MNVIDMSWGIPAFLFPYWESVSIKTDNLKKPQGYSFGSRSELKDSIIWLHQSVGNANVNNKHIVVAAGATQIILGLLYVLKNIKGADSAWAEPPHFSRFPSLAEFAGLKWLDSKKSITIGTNPNNPDGTVLKTLNKDIMDLTYMWPQYTTAIKKYNHPIMVFSLSKSTGHASTRIGWAIIKDSKIAEALEKFIEYSTSGLSIDAQIKAERVIESQLTRDFTVFEDGKNTLKERWDIIQQLDKRGVFPFKILNSSGMFLWAEGQCPAEILGLDGRMLKGNSNQFRLNIGCSDKTFNDFVNLFSGQK